MLSYFILFLKLGLPLVVAVFFRRWLIALWVIAILVFPLSQFRVAGAPLYVMDGITGILALQIFSTDKSKSARTGLPWHLIFITLGALSTFAGGVLLYGFFGEQLWIWGHFSAVYLGLYIISGIYKSSNPEHFLLPLRWGTMLGLVGCAIIAVIQYFALPGQEELRTVLYGDLTARSSSGDIGEAIDAMWTNVASDYVRVPGSHYAPTAFGGIVLVAFSVLALTEMRRFSILTVIGGLSMLIVTATTVSRHVVLALIIGVIGMLLFGTAKQKGGIMLTLLGLVLLALPYLGYVAAAWETRMDRISTGVLEDENITARVIDGPLRLFDFFSTFPEMIPLGAGLEPEKLISRAGLTYAMPSGFASNGYLLILYYLGLFGFGFYCLFWLRVLREALKSPVDVRGIEAGVALICGVIIASDNYSVVHEPAACFLCIAGACILGEASRQRLAAPPVRADRASTGLAAS